MLKTIFYLVLLLKSIYICFSKQSNEQLLHKYIKNMINEVTNNQTLTTSERRRLKKASVGYGNMKQVEVRTTVHRSTIYAAISGRKLWPETATKLRNYLANL